MNNPETLETLWTITNEQSTGNMEDTGRRQTKHNTAQHNTTQKTKKISNTDPTKNQDEAICSQRESSPPW